jgi:hypothetical protein
MMPEKPQSPLPPKEIDEPARPGADQEHADDRPVLVLVNTFGLAHLWRDLLNGGT